MKPKPRPSVRAKVVVFFDANMPGVQGCHFGCKSNPNHLCRHRFGARIWFAAKTKELQRMKDSQVIEEFLRVITRHWIGPRIPFRPRHYVLATHDKKFLVNAYQEYQSRIKEQDVFGAPLTFGSDWVQSGEGRHAIRVSVFHIPQLDRDWDLRQVLDHTRTLKKIPPWRG